MNLPSPWNPGKFREVCQGLGAAAAPAALRATGKQAGHPVPQRTRHGAPRPASPTPSANAATLRSCPQALAKATSRRFPPIPPRHANRGEDRFAQIHRPGEAGKAQKKKSQRKEQAMPSSSLSTKWTGAKKNYCKQAGEPSIIPDVTAQRQTHQPPRVPCSSFEAT